MFEKDGIVYENVGEFEPDSYKLQRKKKKILIIAVLLLFMSIIFFSCYKAMIPVDYRVFNREKTEFVEQKYMMDFSDVKLERYWTVSMAQDHDANLNFSGVEDYKDFMENSFSGEIISSMYIGMVLDDGTVIEELREENLAAEYKCRTGKTSFIIGFYKDGDSYFAKIVG